MAGWFGGRSWASPQSYSAVFVSIQSVRPPVISAVVCELRFHFSRTNWKGVNNMRRDLNSVLRSPINVFRATPRIISDTRMDVFDAVELADQYCDQEDCGLGVAYTSPGKHVENTSWIR